jgi:tetratricopeptide (TPR) repeat protein
MTALLATVAVAGLGGCVELVSVGGAAYAPFHKPDPRAKAYLLLRQHNCAAANSEFSELLATSPNDAEAISGRADALVCLEKYDDAIADYTRAIQLDPKWFDYFGRGIAYKAKGDRARTLDNFDAGIALAPTVPTLYVYRGVVLTERGDASGAAADFDKVSSLISENRGGFNHYGWALATSPVAAYRDGPAAILYATRACDLSKWNSANDLDTLAAAYAEAGKFDQAVQWQAAALKIGGNIDRDEFEARLAMYQKRQPYRAAHLGALFF